MKSLPFLLIPLLVFASVICAAQDKSNPKFGTISPVDFETRVSSVTDSSTGAINSWGFRHLVGQP